MSSGAKDGKGAPGPGKPSPRALLELAALKARLLKLPEGAPGTLYIALTSRCDLSCRHCKYRSSPPGPDMPFGELRRLLENAASSGIPRAAFFGGEPLLYPRLEQAVRLASGLGLFTQLDTNGQTLDAGRAGELASAGLSLATISLHSAEEAGHDALGGPGSFRKAVAAVSAALRAGLFVHVSSCFFSAGLSSGEPGRLAAFARGLGAHGVRALLYSPPEGGSARLPRRLSRTLAKAAPDGFSRGCVRPGRRACAAAAGEILFTDAELNVKSCPYAVRPLGKATAGLSRFFGGERAPAGLFPCHSPGRSLRRR